MLHGFDISAYQGTAAPAADFDLVKATEGSGYTSSKFAAQWASAKTRAKHRGGYHFARPEESSYRDQVSRFLDVVQPRIGESVMLDLEASKLSQSATNAWARGWGDEIRGQAPGITSLLYMGNGYATNGTGRGLAQHFDLWMYPRYPSAYQLTHELTLGTVDLEARRAENRSSLVTARTRIARATTKWPTSVSPWLPNGLTCGWSRPDIWQFTDNFGGLDASVSALTIAQLANGGQKPQEEDMLSGSLTPGKGEKAPIGFPPGTFTKIRLFFDNTRDNPELGITRQGPAVFRLAPHQPGRKGTTDVGVTVGATLTDAQGRPDAVEVALPAGCDYIAVERSDDGGRPVGFCVY